MTNDSRMRLPSRCRRHHSLYGRLSVATPPVMMPEHGSTRRVGSHDADFMQMPGLAAIFADIIDPGFVIGRWLAPDQLDWHPAALFPLPDKYRWIGIRIAAPETGGDSQCLEAPALAPITRAVKRNDISTMIRSRNPTVRWRAKRNPGGVIGPCILR
jgi:hypothetical protein